MRGFAPCSLCVAVQAGPYPGVVLPQQKEAAGASIAPADLLNPVGGNFRERAPLTYGVWIQACDVTLSTSVGLYGTEQAAAVSGGGRVATRR